MNHDPKPIIIALDNLDQNQVLSLTAQIDPSQCRVKVGKELFTLAGPQLVERLIQDGFDVFLDLKFHDIPNTVAGACRRAADMGVWMVNVHASGGLSMMQAAREAVDQSTTAQKPLLIAVTVLTSMNAEELSRLGIVRSLEEQVDFLSTLTHQAGLDGVVCSAQEADHVRQKFGHGFVRVCPGIRPEWAAKGDQKRIMTPKLAVDSGATYLVIGRPITQADDPMKAIEKIRTELEL